MSETTVMQVPQTIVQLFQWFREGYSLRHVNSHGYHIDPNRPRLTAVQWRTIEPFFRLGLLIRSGRTPTDKRWVLTPEATLEIIAEALAEEQAMADYLHGRVPWDLETQG